MLLFCSLCVSLINLKISNKKVEDPAGVDNWKREQDRKRRK